MSEAVAPRPLKRGDTIAIVSPASSVNPEFIDEAVKVIESQGFKVIVYPHSKVVSGSFAGTREERLADISAALTNPDVRAVLCSRGGYGCVQLIGELARLPLSNDAKWLIGFSDVTALHALMASKGIVSIHSSMAKALATQPLGSESNKCMIDMLRGERPTLTFPSAEGNRCGTATGVLAGGNLAVAQALIGTPFNVFRPGTILFIEDIAEPIYKVNRIMWQLRLAGILDRVAGIIFGQFTDYRPNRDFMSMEQMLRETIGDIQIPVAFNAPIGHTETNHPILYSARARLTVTPAAVTLEYI